MTGNEMAEVAQASGTSWFDIFGLIVATMSFGITVILVMVAWHLSRSYLQSIKEMEDIRTSSQTLAHQISGLNELNATLLREAMLAVRTIFDLLMTTERRDAYQAARERLVSLHQWKGQILSDDEVTQYDERIQAELEGVNATVTARIAELYWLVGESTERAAHLHALATTKGDYSSVDLLEQIRRTKTEPDERDELLVAISTLRQRLGRPAVVTRRRYSTRL